MLGYGREQPGAAPISGAVVDEGWWAGGVGWVVVGLGLEVGRDPYWESRFITTAVLDQDSEPVVPHL